uniref:(northern house mosquito) hypothetical protein n=1 Tax=Culex pipiens TaxID=7175 RepID=A0A8D8CY92_CULPI
MREREIDREEGANQTILYQKNVQQVFLLVGVFSEPEGGPFLESVVRIAIPSPDPPSWSLIALLSPCFRGSSAGQINHQGLCFLFLAPPAPGRGDRNWSLGGFGSATCFEDCRPAPRVPGLARKSRTALHSSRRSAGLKTTFSAL